MDSQGARINVLPFPAAVCIGASTPFAAAGVDEAASPIFGVKIPPGYRDWGVISVAHEAGNNNDLRVILGNDVAIKAYREGKLPFPDGTIIAALHWTRVPSEDNNKVLAGPFPGAQSFVVESSVNVQFMVKGLKKVRGDGRLGVR